MHSIARVSVQFVYFHLYVLCLVYDEYDNKAIIIIIQMGANDRGAIDHRGKRPGGKRPGGK